MTAFAPALERRGSIHRHSFSGSTSTGHLPIGVTLMVLLMVLITAVLAFVVFRRMLRAERQRLDHPAPPSRWTGDPAEPPADPPIETLPAQDHRAPQAEGLPAGPPSRHRFSKF